MADDSASSKGTERGESKSSSSSNSSSPGRGSEGGYGNSSSSSSSSSSKSSSSGSSSGSHGSGTSSSWGGRSSSGSSGGSDQRSSGERSSGSYGSGTSSNWGGKQNSGSPSNSSRDDRGGSYNSGYGSASPAPKSDFGGLGNISDRDWNSITDRVIGAVTSQLPGGWGSFPRSDYMVDIRNPNVARIYHDSLSTVQDDINFGALWQSPGNPYDYMGSYLKGISSRLPDVPLGTTSQGILNEADAFVPSKDYDPITLDSWGTSINPGSINQFASFPSSQPHTWSNMEKIHDMNMEDRKLVNTVGPYLSKAFGLSLGQGIVDASQYAKTAWGEVGSKWGSPENLAAVAQVMLNRSNLAATKGQYGGTPQGVMAGFDANGYDQNRVGGIIGPLGNSAFQSATPGTPAYQAGLNALYGRIMGTGPELPNAVQNATNYRANSMGAPSWEQGVATTTFGPHTFSNPDPGRPASTVMAANNAMQNGWNPPQATSPQQLNPQVQAWVRDADKVATHNIAPANYGAKLEPATFNPARSGFPSPQQQPSQSAPVQQSAPIGVDPMQSGMAALAQMGFGTPLPSASLNNTGSLGVQPGLSANLGQLGSSPLNNLFSGGINPMDSPVVGPNQYVGENFAGKFSDGPVINPVASPTVDTQDDLDSYYRELPGWDGLPKRADVPLTPGAPGKTDREFPPSKDMARLPSTGEINDPWGGKPPGEFTPVSSHHNWSPQNMEAIHKLNAQDRMEERITGTDPLPDIDNYADPANPNDPSHDVGPEPYDNRGWSKPAAEETWAERKAREAKEYATRFVKENVLDPLEKNGVTLDNAGRKLAQYNWWHGDGQPNWRPDAPGDRSYPSQMAQQSAQQQSNSPSPTAPPILPPELTTLLAGLTAEDLQNMSQEELQILEELLTTLV